MPARATIAINDGETVPAAHSFTPQGGDAYSTSYQEKVGLTSAGWKGITHVIQPPTGQRTTHKAEVSGFIPTEASVGGVPTVTGSASFKLTLNFPPNLSLQERKNALAYLKNWLANATVTQSIVDLEPFY
jgi:hypothetical protein